jgi:hypothetical protein
MQGQQIQSGVQGDNAKTNAGLLGGVVNAGQGVLGILTRAGGGPVEPGQPYLVGEQGPEIIMPAAHGLVIPAPQTNAMLAQAGGPSDNSFGGASGLFAGAAPPRKSIGGNVGPAPASFDVMNKDGSMNVLGSLKAHSDFATRFQRDPMGGSQRGGM